MRKWHFPKEAGTSRQALGASLDATRRALATASLAATAALLTAAASPLTAPATLRERTVGMPPLPPELAELKSSNQLAATRRELVNHWRTQPIASTGAEVADATRVLLTVRAAIRDAEEHARRKRWAALDAALPLSLVREMEAAATVLYRSGVLDEDAREAIGWPWGSCGWRRCGAQADAAQAICKLRASLGMIVPLEALFYLDVAKRAVDEMIGVACGTAACEGGGPYTSIDYMPAETLEMFLVRDDEEGGTEAQDYIQAEERALLEAAGILSAQDGSFSWAESDGDDDAEPEPP